MRKRLYLILFLPLLLIACGGKGGLQPGLKHCIKNPECASSDGRLIIGFTYPEHIDDPLYRGPVGMVAVYEGDPIPDEFYDH